MTIKMNIQEKLDEENETTFPDGKIVTLDGKMLECYPVANRNVNVVDDEMKLDTTGRYFAIGRRLSPMPTPPKEEEEQKALFIDNAFYLLAHKDRILSDSRMFLCPIAVQSGLAYTGTSGFTRPTLGIYLEWWSIAPQAMQVDEEGHKLLVYLISGSPLSGCNNCAAIRDDGKHKTVTLLPFSSHWGSFTQINTRYTESKYMYQAYNLKEVLDILHTEDDGNLDYAHQLELEYMRHEIELANRLLAKEQARCRDWQQKYAETIIKYHEKRMCDYYAEYERVKANAEMEMTGLRQQKSELKAELKSGRMDNIAYQKNVCPMNKRIKELKNEVSSFKYGKLREAFPDEEGITFQLIEQTVLNKRDLN